VSDTTTGAKVEIHADQFAQPFNRCRGLCQNEYRPCEFFAQRDFHGFAASRKNAVMPDFAKTVRQNVQHEPSDKFHRRHSHGFLFVVVAVVSPRESDIAGFQTQNTVIGHSDAVRVTTKVLNDLGGVFERRFTIDDPFALIQSRIKSQVCPFQEIEKFSSKLSCRHLDGEEELSFGTTPLTVLGQSAARDDAMDMRVIHQVLAPSMQNRHNSRSRAEIFRVGAEFKQGLYMLG
jgi:hypothetical protein